MPELTERQADQKWLEDSRFEYQARAMGLEFLGYFKGAPVFARSEFPDGA